jgi:diguanylate cyclase (GGDEF)-like protein
MIDIDNFKHINDTFGHPAGDQVIRRVAEVIARSVRVTDYVTRIGGDEFMVILPTTDQVAAATLAERCRSAVESSRWPNQRVRVSIGVAQLSPYASDAAALIVAVDQCLLRAKRAGSNRVWVAERPHKGTDKNVSTVSFANGLFDREDNFKRPAGTRMPSAV